MVKFESEAKLPTRYGEFRIRVYREGDKEHAVLIREPLEEPVLVRVHSECLTGDVFGSLRCDCGEQLEYALQKIGQEGGVLIYLRQEGRGIGLANKIRAYYLQDMGMDTVEANHQLGFEADLRNYEPAFEILRDLGISRIRLMTNNPSKIVDLTRYGIEVVERIPVQMKPNPHNEKYLRTKKEKLGHLLNII